MNLEQFGLAAIPAITVICYLIGMIAKATPIDNKWIPVIVAIISAVATILVGTFGWAKKEEIDNLKSVVETQNEKIDELESQIEVLIDDTEEK